jgi:hypothetical protein
VIKNTWAGDLALVELLTRGHSEAPQELLLELARRGHVALLAGGRARLTGKGRTRATKLRGAENDMRTLFAAKDGAAVKTVGGGPFHVGGGSARIRS